MLKIMSATPAFRGSKMVQVSDDKQGEPKVFVNPKQVLAIKKDAKDESMTNIFLAASMDDFNGNVISVNGTPAVVASKFNAEA